MGNDPAEKGIIVLGMPRSGTTLLRRILNAHPSIACGGETFLLRATAQFLDSDTIVDGIDYGVLGGLQSAGFSKNQILSKLREFAFEFLREYAAKQGKKRWATKSAVDSFYIDQIEELYGDHAKFVCIVRHGLDAVCSLEDLCIANEVYIKELHHYVRQYPRTLEAFAHAWRDVTDRLLEFARRQPDRALLIRYEDLVADPERKSVEIFEFLGEKPNDRVLKNAIRLDSIEGLGDWKAHSRPTIDDSSVGRSSALREDQVSRMGMIMNATLRDCGYNTVPVKPLPSNEEAIRRLGLLLRFDAARVERASTSPDLK